MTHSISRDLTQTINVTDPSDVVGLIPYILGYYPHESLVALVCTDSHIEVTMRIDNDQLSADSVALGQLTDVIKRHGDAQWMIASFSASYERALDICQKAEQIIGDQRIIGSLIVTPQFYWSRNPMLNAISQPVAYDISATSAAAQAVYAGWGTCDNRADLFAYLKPPIGRAGLQSRKRIDQAELVLLRCSAQQNRDRIETIYRLGIAAIESLTVEDCAFLAALATHRVWCKYLVEKADVALSNQLTHIWTKVVTHTARDYQFHSLVLLSLWHWMSGNGVMQNICLEAASQLNQTSGLMNVLLELSAQAIHPRQ